MNIPKLLPWFGVALLNIAVCALAHAAATDFALHDGDRVVFYGDSITQHGDYAQFVEAYSRCHFPTWDLRFFNAGVGGDTVRGGSGGDVDVRLTRDVIRLKPTVVTIMLGMNDGGYGSLTPAILAAFNDGYRALVARLREAMPTTRIYLIRTSPFDDFSRAPDFSSGYNQTLRQLGDAVAAIGRDYQLTVVDFDAPVGDGIKRVAEADPVLAAQLLPDRVHPGTAAHLVMAATLLRTWHAPATVTRVEIDAKSSTLVAAENTQLSALAASGTDLSWSQLDQSLPLPLNFQDSDTILAQKSGANLESLDQQQLRVTGLPAGRYEVTIDDRKFGPFTAAQLNGGVNLALYNTPMRWQAYQARWGAETGHEQQRAIRHAYVIAPNHPGLATAADSLSAADEAEQVTRSGLVIPRPHKFILHPAP